LNKIVLASKSPRRLELLRGMGYDVEVDASGIDERTIKNDDVKQLVIDIACAKCSAVASRHPGSVVLAADTLVYFQGSEIHQQETDEEAEAVLRRMCGKEHEVVTGVCVMSSGRKETAGCVSRVRLKPVAESVIQQYVKSGQYRGKAGAYNIADPEFESFIESVEGSRSNIVGLPIELVPQLIEKLK